MYRLLAFLFMCGVITFVPLTVLAQDEKPKADDPKVKADDKKADDKKTDDKKTDEPKKADEVKKTDEPAKTEDPKKTEEVKKTDDVKKPVAVATASSMREEPETFTDMWRRWLNTIATGVAPVAGLFIMAIIAIVLMGLRSDINRLADLIVAQSEAGKKDS